MKIHVTEHKSVAQLNPLSRTVRVFVNHDYHYGYFVDEHLLFSLLSPEQQAVYLQGIDARLDVTPEVAQRLIDDGTTPYQKAQVC